MLSSQGDVSPYLSKLADIANLPALQAAEVGGDSAVLEVHDSRERLVEKGADGSHREATGFCCKSVDHSFESHVDFAGSNDLGHVCCYD
jgi:hypothetical protein